MDAVEDIESQKSSLAGNVFIPQLSNDHVPKLGQEFESLNDVHEFYNRYAKEVGFSVRSNSSKKDKDTNNYTRKEYVCYKEGTHKGKEACEKKRRRGILREGCKAKLAVKRSKTGTYVVSLFVEGHNHPLTTPKRVHLLRSHRTVSEAKKSLTQQFSAVNIPTHQQMSILELQAGGLENVGCTQKDIYNYQRTLRCEMKGHDVDVLNDYFMSEQEKNSGFVFKIKLDNDNKLTHCFWADATSRCAYAYYGDVIVFDTTYNTNKYSLIFAPIMGVNNHGQTILFACAFLNDETADSFIWLFEEFKKVMSDSPPKMIITDQDLAMSKAISYSFPNSFHRYCIWHILDKFSIRIDAIIYRDHYKDFQKCIWESETCEEFDTNWMKVIEKSNLVDNTWLPLIFDIRSKWVPAYVNHVFSAGMSSSQRAESSHAFFKRYVYKENTLMDFITRFNRALARQRHDELIAYHIDMNEKPLLKLPLDIEKQMSEIYTCKMFYKFQDELWNSFSYVIELKNEDANHCVHGVGKRNEMECKVRKVVYDRSLNFASCSCKKFESEGIPCRHIMACLINMQISHLPSQYILNRWTKNAKSKIVFDGERVLNDGSENSILFRRTKLLQLASGIIEKAVTNEEACVLLTDNLEHVLKKIEPMIESSKSGVLYEKKNSEKTGNMNDPHMNEPDQVRAKGCGKRLKRGKEKGQSKVRRCNGCGKVGQSHDKRNCPMLCNRNNPVESNTVENYSEYESDDSEHVN